MIGRLFFFTYGGCIGVAAREERTRASVGSIGPPRNGGFGATGGFSDFVTRNTRFQRCRMAEEAERVSWSFRQVLTFEGGRYVSV